MQRALLRAGAALRRARAISTGSPLLTHPRESFLNGVSAGYVEDMYNAWQQSPDSVHVSWRSLFSQIDAGALPSHAFIPPSGLHIGATLESAGAAQTVGTASLPPEAAQNVKVCCWIEQG